MYSSGILATFEVLNSATVKYSIKEGSKMGEPDRLLEVENRGTSVGDKFELIPMGQNSP